MQSFLLIFVGFRVSSFYKIRHLYKLQYKTLNNIRLVILNFQENNAP